MKIQRAESPLLGHYLEPGLKSKLCFPRKSTHVLRGTTLKTSRSQKAQQSRPVRKEQEEVAAALVLPKCAAGASAWKEGEGFLCRGRGGLSLSDSKRRGGEGPELGRACWNQ